MVIGFVMWIPLIAIYVSMGIYFGNIDINLEKSYEQEYNNCQVREDRLMGDYVELKEHKQIVCEYKEPKINFWMPFWAFLVGVAASGYAILFLYPIAKYRLEKSRKGKNK